MDGSTHRLLDRILADLDEGREPDPARLSRECDRSPEALADLIDVARCIHARFPPDRRLAQLQPGDRLGEFEIVGALAQGGCGVIYVAKQISLAHRRVALKVVRSTLGEVQRARFRREAELLAPVHHPHLAEVYGHGEEREYAYIAMQLVEGRDLSSVLADFAGNPERVRPPETRRRIVEWAGQVASALERIHALGLVHRDVKPANIVLHAEDGPEGNVSRGSAVLVDFGLVRSLDAVGATRTGDRLLTYEYAAPEQVMGRPTGPPADTFALGVTLYDLLSGTLPDRRPRASAGLPPLRSVAPWIDRDLAAVVDRAVSIPSALRYPDGGRLRADLEAWLRGAPVSANPASPLRRGRLWVRRHPGRAARAVVGTLLAIGFLAAVTWTSAGLRTLARFRRTLSTGDLAQLLVSAQELPAPFRRAAALGSASVARALSRLEGDPGDLLARAAEAERRGDSEEALVAAATELRREGASAEPVLVRFLTRALERDEELPGGDPVRQRALELCARVLMERPVRSIEEARRFEPLRGAASKLWADEALPRGNRLFVLTMFSGVGRAEDAEWLCDWAVDAERAAEEARLAYVVVDRLLARAQRMGLLADVDLEAIERKLVAWLTPRLAGMSKDGDVWSVGADSSVSAALTALEAASLALRMRGGVSHAIEVFPASWRDATPDRNAHQALAVWHVLGAADPRELRRRADRWERTSEVPGFAVGAAQSLAMAGLDDVIARARRRLIATLRGNDRSTKLEYMDKLTSYGRNRALGIALYDAPDPDTLLGLERVEPNSLKSNEVAESGDPPGPAAIAAWWVTEKGVVNWGEATSFAAHQATYLVSEDFRPCLRCFDFGHSAVRLRFRLPKELVRPYLDVEHLAAGRGLLPFVGDVDLRIRIDGSNATTYRLVHSHWHTNRFELDREFFTPGPHEIEIAIGLGTTTTYRLRSVILGDAERTGADPVEEH